MNAYAVTDVNTTSVTDLAMANVAIANSFATIPVMEAMLFVPFPKPSIIHVFTQGGCYYAADLSQSRRECLHR